MNPPPSQTAISIVKFLEQIVSAVGSPISTVNWPVYVYQTVSIVYSLSSLDTNAKKLLAGDIIEQLIQTSTHLTTEQKAQIVSVVDQSAEAVIDVLLNANSEVIDWVEHETETCWKRLKAWWLWLFPVSTIKEDVLNNEHIYELSRVREQRLCRINSIHSSNQNGM